MEEMTISTIRLTLSDIEQTFYDNIYKELKKTVQQQGTLSMNDLTRLRQACCHPQVRPLLAILPSSSNRVKFLHFSLYKKFSWLVRFRGLQARESWGLDWRGRMVSRIL